MANNKVYTESVVTLNGQQAQEQVQKLRDKAAELRKQLQEMGNVDLNSKEYKKIYQQLQANKKAQDDITESTKKFAQVMNNINGANLNQLYSAAKKLNNQLRGLTPGTKEFVAASEKLKEVRGRIKELQGETKQVQSTFGSFFSKIGWAGLVAGALKAFKGLISGMISTTQSAGDAWRREVAGWKNAWETFTASLASGDGFKDIISNMQEAYAVGHKVYDLLDEIKEMTHSLSMKEADYSDELERNRQIMMDTTYTYKEREEAAQRVIDIEAELARDRKAIASQELDANTMLLEQKTKMTEADRDYFIKHYNENKEIIHQAQAYGMNLREIKNLEAGILELRYDNADSDPLGLGRGQREKTIEQYQTKLEKVKKIVGETKQEVIDAYIILQKYNRTNDELVDKWVEAYVKHANVEAETMKSTRRAQKTLNAMREEQSKAAQTALNEQYKNEIKTVDDHTKELQNIAKQAYLDGQTSEAEYQQRLIDIQEEALKQKIAINEKFKQSTIDLQSQLLDLALADKAKLEKIWDSLSSDIVKAVETSLSDLQKEIDDAMQYIDKDIEDANKHWADLNEQAAAIRAELNPVQALNDQMNEELASLQEMYDEGLLSEEEFQKKKAEIISRYSKLNLQKNLEPIQKGIEKVQQWVSQADSFVSALQEASMAKLEARMAAELSAAGDNAEKRKEIEEKYEKEKLDVQKKYADVDMAMNIAKTVAAGALAAVKGYAELGPIAGAIFAAVIAATTAAQVAVIIAQRNAIKNASISSSGSGSTVGERVATGFSEGGYTARKPNDYQEVGVVHANEWVAPAAMVRANPVLFATLESARKNRNYQSGVPGFADGGSVGDDISAASGAVDNALLSKTYAVMDLLLKSLPLPAYVVHSQLNAKAEVEAEIKKITGKQ